MVNSHNEWDPLEEVILGRVDMVKFPKNDPGLFLNSHNPAFRGPNISFRMSQFIIEETQEDLENFSRELTKLGITVHRPDPIDTRKKIQTPFWKSEQYFNYCPRDIFSVIGTTLLESANIERARYFESFSYRKILLKYLDNEVKWICAPKPQLRDDDYNPALNARSTIQNNEPMFDAANILRAGKDIFYLVSSSGNELGFKWLQNVFGDDYRIHACRSIYAGVHVDSTISLLSPGLFLANPSRVNSKNMSKPLKKWKAIYAPKMQGPIYAKSMTLSSSWLGMNILMINPRLAVVDVRQKELIKLLEKNKIDVLPLQLRHGRTLAGGFHCITLDVRRKGKKEDYFS